MKFKYISIIAIAITFLIISIPGYTKAEDTKTDLKIITYLDSGGFITPALYKNGTFVYNNFEFHLYSNTNNTSYRILVDNITISSSIILNFKDVFYWNTEKSYIDLLEVYISDDYYIYSNIFIFSSSVTNRTVIRDDDEDLIKFTPEELKRYVQEIELKAVGRALVGSFFSVYIFYRLVKRKKEQTIKRIL